MTISAAQINTFSVSTTNLQVLATPVTYTFNFVTNGLILLNYYIQLSIPTQFGVNLTFLSCTINSRVFPCWYSAP